MHHILNIKIIIFATIDDGKFMKKTKLFRKIIFFLLLIGMQFPGKITAQNNSSAFFRDSVNLTIKHRKYERYEQINQQRYTDKFIEAFSKSIPRILAYTTYSIHWQQEITRKNKSLIFKASGIHIRGNKTYRDFPVEKLMIPENLEIKSTFLHKDQDTLLLKDTLSPGQETSTRLQLPDSLNGRKMDFLSFDYQLLYSNSRIKKFQQKTEAVDQYYRDYPILKNTLETVGSITISNLNMLPIQNTRLKKAENTLEKIEESSYLTILDLEKHDPLNFLPRFKNLRTGIRFKRKKADRKMKNMDRLLFREGKNYLDSDTSVARGYLEKSIRTNPYFTPAHLELAKLELTQQKLFSSAERIEHILNKLKPDTQNYQAVMQFSDTLVNAFLQRCKTLLNEEDYNEAKDIMERAKQFCENTPRYECTSRVDKYLSRAHYGIYNSYISVARQALYKRRPSMALEYIRMVEKFRKKHNSSIVSGEVINELYDKTAKQLINRASQLREVENFEKANKLLNKADTLCKTEDCYKNIKEQTAGIKRKIYQQKLNTAKNYLSSENIQTADQKLKKAESFRAAHSEKIDKLPLRDTLRRKIDYQLYREKLNKGSLLLGVERPAKALIHFTKARCLLDQYNFEINDTLDSLVRVAARPVIMEKIKHGKLKAWGKKITQAKKILRNIREDIQKYKLDNDPETNAALENFMAKLNNKICETVRDTFRNYTKRAEDRINKDNYLLARKNFRQALKLTKRYEQCEIDSLSIRNKLSKYHPYFQFERKKQQLDTLCQKNDHQHLLEKVKQLREFSNAHNITANVPTPLTLAKKYEDTKLLFSITEHYLEKRKPEQALKALKMLRKNGINREKTKSLQKKCGTLLARQNDEKEFQGDYKKKAAEYADHSEWFKILERSYNSTWRKVKGIFPYFF